MDGHTPAQTQSKAPTEIAVVIVFLITSWVSISLRFWVRGRMINSLGWDDAFMLVAAVFFTVFCGALLMTIRYGGGTHSTDLESLDKAIDWVIVDEVFYLWTIIFAKLSLGVFFLRIVIRKWQRRIIYALMTITVVVNFFHFWYVIFMCGDPKYFFIKYISGQCLPHAANLAIAYEQAAVTAVTDWIFALLPITIVWNANMDIRSKLSVGFILALGAVGSICSVVRFRYVAGLVTVDDFFWSAANTAIWSTVELGTGITAGCLATLRPLLRRIAHQARSITGSVVTASSKHLPRSPKNASSPSAGSSRLTHNQWDNQWDQRAIGRGQCTTMCVGGPGVDAEFAVKGEVAGSVVELRDASPERSWSRAGGENEDGIAKVVNVDVKVLESNEIEDGHAGGPSTAIRKSKWADDAV